MSRTRGSKSKDLGPGRIQPEPGDPQVIIGSANITRALREIGVREGDVLMVHSSLSSMGTVDGGVDAVIDGFLDAVGPQGTVAVPSLWYRPGVDVTQWDKDHCPPFTGVVSDTLRRRPDAFRSDNPSHAVAAIGPRAQELTATHGETGLRPGMLGDRSFAADSPWEKLYRWDAAYCFVGVDMLVNTLGHYAEYVLVDGILSQLPDHLRSALSDRLSGWFMSPGAWPKFDLRALGQELEDQGFVRRDKIGSATLRYVRARQSVDESIGIALGDPDRWLDAEFVKWLEDARTAVPPDR